jgi:3-hydroxybutyryl-CoA dehydrogenase
MRGAGLRLADPVEGPPGLRCDETLAVAPGTTAAAATLVDLALDYGTCTRLAVAADHGEPPAPLVGALQACGIAVTPVPARPGLVLARLLAMLVNEATDMVDQGTVSAADLDLAMRKGVNYPRGPLEWAAHLPASLVPAVLDQLWAATRDSRYARAAGLVG